MHSIINYNWQISFVSVNIVIKILIRCLFWTFEKNLTVFAETKLV